MVDKVSEGPKLDWLLWSLVLIFVATGIGGNYYFVDRSLLIRVVGMLVFAGAAIALASKTSWGQKTALLFIESIQEVRKIYWPTRQETLQTTFAVLAMVLVMGILLWTVDFVLLRAVGWLTGHWGV